VLTDEERSVHTVMVYLNDQRTFGEGETVFHDFKKGRYTTMQAVRGKGLVFKHELWHEGKPLTRGHKYILRTDLMFRRVSAAPLASLRFVDDPKFKEAEALYQKSIACVASTCHRSRFLTGPLGCKRQATLLALPRRI